MRKEVVAKEQWQGSLRILGHKPDEAQTFWYPSFNREQRVYQVLQDSHQS